MDYIELLDTEVLKKMLDEIKDNLTLAFIRRELLKRGEL